MQTNIAGTWDREELKAAITLSRPINPVALAAVMVLAVVALILLETGGSITLGNVITAGISVAVALVVMLVAFRLQAERQLNARWFQGDVQGQVDAQLISLRTEVSNAELHWAHLKKVKANDQAIVLVQATNVSMVLLRNWFDSDQTWSELIDFCHRQVDRAAAGELLDASDPPIVDGTLTDGATLEPPVNGIVFGGPMNKAELVPIFAKVEAVRRLRRILLAVIGIVAAVAVLLTVLGSDGRRFLADISLLVIVIVVLGVVVIATPRYAANRYAKAMALQTFEGVASEQGMQTRIGQSASAMLWSTFVNASINDRSIGLMASDQVVLPVLRSWFDSDEDWQRFVDLVQQNVAVR